MMLKIYLLIGSLFFWNIVVAQSPDKNDGQTTDRQGVVVSSNSLDKPDPSAILHLNNQEGESAGLKFPELEIPSEAADLNNDGIIDATEFAKYLNVIASKPENGLLFYNPEGGLQGFYYYDENSSIKWLQISSGNEKNIGLPDGTIIEYAGDLNLFTEDGIGKRGTAAEGWFICNGKNNTPNLTASFLKGFNGEMSNDNIGSDGRQQNSDYIVLTSENLPQHTHDVKDFTLNGGHDHKVVVVPHEEQHEIYARNAKKIAARNHADGNHTIAYRYAYEKNSKKGDLESSTMGIYNTDRSSEPKDMKASLVKSEDVVAGEWLDKNGAETPTAIDTRPSFFVVVYIMKIEKPRQAINYLKR